MLNKILCNKILQNLSFHKVSSHARASENPSGRAEKRSRALKIIHVGGRAECYYMAVPAASIIDKYPEFILARPEIFLRPWESIVGPDEILVPGQRYYVVPMQTVKKLRHRIKKSSVITFITKSSLDQNYSNSASKSSFMAKSGTKGKAQDRHVRFLDQENKKKESGSSRTENLVPYDQKKGNSFMKKKGVIDKRISRDQFENSWEPSLNAIDE